MICPNAFNANPAVISADFDIIPFYPAFDRPAAGLTCLCKQVFLQKCHPHRRPQRFPQPSEPIVAAHTELIPDAVEPIAAARRRKRITQRRVGEDGCGEDKAMNIKAHIRADTLAGPGAWGRVFMVDIVKSGLATILRPEEMAIQSARKVADRRVRQARPALALDTV